MLKQEWQQNLMTEQRDGPIGTVHLSVVLGCLLMVCLFDEMTSYTKFFPYSPKIINGHMPGLVIPVHPFSVSADCTFTKKIFSIILHNIGMLLS